MVCTGPQMLIRPFQTLAAPQSLRLVRKIMGVRKTWKKGEVPEGKLKR